MVIAVSGKAARPLFRRRKTSRRAPLGSRQMTQRECIATCFKLQQHPASNNRETLPIRPADQPTVRPAAYHTRSQTHQTHRGSLPDRRKQFLLFLCRAFDGRDAQRRIQNIIIIAGAHFYYPLRARWQRDGRLRLNASEPPRGFRAAQPPL